MDDKVKQKQLTLRLPEKIHRDFKVMTVRQGRSMGEVATELIMEYLKKQTQRPL